MDNLRSQISTLIAEFAWRIDHDEGRLVEDLFTEDGRYGMVGYPVQGRAAIKDLYDRRRARGPRTSRHLFDNLYLHPTSTQDCARVTSVLTLHAADGPPPHPLRPVLVADYDDVCHRGPDGRWRFHSRDATLLFAAPQPEGEAPR